MENKLYVGNLNYSTGESELLEIFQPCGEVKTINIITDRYTGQSKGFAFVEMGDNDSFQKALALNGAELSGRNLNISEARPKTPRASGPRGGSGGSGGRGDRGPKRYGRGGGTGGSRHQQKKGPNWKW